MYNCNATEDKYCYGKVAL